MTLASTCRYSEACLQIRPRGGLLNLLGLLAILCLVSPASAGLREDLRALPSPCVDIRCQGTAVPLCTRGLELEDRGLFNDAISAYLSAYKQTRSCRLLLAIVSCYVSLDDLEAASQLVKMVPKQSQDEKLLIKVKEYEQFFDARLSNAKSASLPVVQKAPEPAVPGEPPYLPGSPPPVEPSVTSGAPDQAARPSAPQSQEPADARPGPPTIVTSSQPPAPAAVAGLASPISSPRVDRPIPIHKRWWLWTSVGAGLVAVTAIGVGVGLTSQTPRGPAFPSDFSGYGNPVR